MTPDRTDAQPVMPTRRLVLALGVLACVAFVFYQYATWRQYAGGMIRGDAVHTFDTMLSRFAAGEGMLNQRIGSHFFANHAMLWLYPVGWLYRAFDSLWTYLTPLNLLLAAAVIPLGLFAHARTGNERLALLIAALFATNTLTASLRLSVHPESLIPVWWFVLFLGLEWRRTPLVVLGVVGMLCIKEDQAVWLAVFAVWGLAFGRLPRRTGWALLASGVAGFVALKGLMLSVPQPPDDPEAGFWWIARYGIDASSPPQALAWFATHPHVLAARVLWNETWLALALAGGIVAWRAWRELLLLVPGALLLFSAQPGDPFHTAQYYYGYLFLPPLFLAVCEGCRLQQHSTSPARLQLGIGLLALVALVLPTRVEGWSQNPWRFADLPDHRAFVRGVLLDRPDARAAMHYDLGAWAPRGWQVLHLRPDHLERADLLLLDLQRVSADIGREATIALIQEATDPEGPWRLVEHFESLALFERQEQAP